MSLLGNLDSESAKGVIELLNKIAKDKLVIVVTHNYEQIEQYVTRKIKMHDGKIIEDKVIKQIKVEKSSNNEITYKNLSLFNKLRLGIRNTFNIKTKFALLLLVFLFITTSVISEYASFKKQEHLAQKSGLNYFFQNTSEDRIVIKKKDKTAFSEEEYKKIQEIDNVKYIVKNDLLLDFNINLDNEKSIYLYGTANELERFEGNLDEGRMPENEHEIIIVHHEDETYYGVDENGYYMPISLIGQEVYLMDNYSDKLDKSFKLKIVGVKYDTENVYDYSKPMIYLSDEVIEKIRFQINQEYSDIKTLFQDKYYEQDPASMYFKIIPNEKVPQGKAYASTDLNGYCKNGSCIGKSIKVELKNLYYTDSLEFKIEKTYTKNNIKNLLGIKEYDQYNGAIFINTADYNSLFNKNTYQSSVFIKDVSKIDETITNLDQMGFTTLPIKDVLVNDGMTQLYRILRIVVTLVLVVALIFISYFVIRIILKSRNIYFSTIRMLGASQKISKQLLIIELFIVSTLAFLIYMIIAFLNYKQILNWGFAKDIIEYMSLIDVLVTYVILAGMSYIISLKYSKKLFKNSSITTYNEEV